MLLRFNLFLFFLFFRGKMSHVLNVFLRFFRNKNRLRADFFFVQRPAGKDISFLGKRLRALQFRILFLRVIGLGRNGYSSHFRIFRDIGDRYEQILFIFRIGLFFLFLFSIRLFVRLFFQLIFRFFSLFL